MNDATKKGAKKMIDTTKMTINREVKINGHHLTVRKVGDLGADLQGPRGAWYHLIQNIHNPDVWTLLDNSAKCRATRITSVEYFESHVGEFDNWEQKQAKIARGRELLADEDVRSALKFADHPDSWQNENGKNRLDWAEHKMNVERDTRAQLEAAEILEGYADFILKYCSACERELNPGRIVWFEVNCSTLEAWEVDKGAAPAWAGTEDSQGCFPYGACCARKVRKAGRAIFA
jgi:hypothetical protein